VLGGWIAESERAIAFALGRIPMAPSTAALFVLFGALLALDGAGRGPRREVALWAAGVGTAVAGLLLVLSLAGVTLPAERLWLGITGEVGGAPVGHMSPLTAFAFLLVGVSYALTTREDRRTFGQIAFIIATILELLAIGLVAAYILGRPLLYETGAIPPALNTSLGFVVLGGGLLGKAAGRIWATAAPDALSPRPALGLVAIMAVAAVVIMAPAYVVFRDYRTEYREEVETQLRSVADLKVDQIREWRDERIRDAEAFYGNRVFAGLVEAALYQGDQEAAAQLRDWLAPIASTFQYRRIAILDSTGVSRIEVPVPGPGTERSPHSAEDAKRAMASGRVALEGFHRDSPDGPVHLTVLAPLMDSRGGALGAVAIRVDPATYLYPLLSRWPVFSRTAEALLVRRDGDDALFLNNLRFDDSAALRLRIPLANTDLPAARAILGEEGIVEGIDYRGERVIAAVRAIPDSDWRLVVRVDTEEALGPMRQELQWAIARVMALFVVLVMALGFLWQRREKLHLKEKLLERQRDRTLLQSIGDAVIATDPDGRVEMMNPVAETLTGWSEEEAVGRPLIEVFRIVNEETREPVENPVAEIIRSGLVVGLANSTILIARDGTERPIADSGAPVVDDEGQISGVILVFRDQTSEREGSRRLQEAVEQSQLYLDVAGVMIVVLDGEGRVRVINRRGTEILGCPAEEILGEIWFDRFIPEANRETVRELHAHTMAGEAEESTTARNPVLDNNGEERIIEWRNTVIRDADGQVIRTVSSGQDVTERIRADQTLRRSEARYRNLFNSIRDAILVAGTDRKIIGCNSAFTDLFGYEESEILGQPTSMIYESDEEFVAMGRELQANIADPNFVQTIRYRTKTGGVFPGETNAFYLTDSLGEVVGFIGLIRDITEREAAVQALEESEQRYRLLFETAPVGIYHTRSDGTALSVNGTMAKILGYDAPEEAVAHFTDLGSQLYIREERRDEFIERLREVGVVENFEYEARHRNGTTIWLQMNARVARDNQDGTFDIAGFAWDITERKRVEAAILRERTMLERTEKLAHIGSWELDAATGEVTWSPELFRIFQRDPEQGPVPFGQNSELFPPEDAERLLEAVHAAIENDESYDMEIRAVRQDGEIRYCRARGFPEHDPDGAARLHGFIEDITALKLKERREQELEAQLTQAQKMEAVGRLAGGVAHDFNNMLSVILGHVELAQEHLDPDHALRPDLDQVRQAAESSAALTRQLLAFAREQVATPVTVDLNETVEGMIKMLRRLIGEDIELRWNPGDDVWPVRIDPVQVNQVLANLLVNARDAIEGVGSITIETQSRTVDAAYTELHADAEAGDYTILTVSDTGHGMDEAVLNKVFEPFFTTKAVGSGTGLGLATVYGIVRQNDGFITVYSEPDQGATFRIHLPRVAGHTPTGAARSSRSPRGVAGTETILVVEDQPAVLGLVEKILGRLGYQVLAAQTPAEALELAGEHAGRIHLLITDVVMPEMNGRQLADRLVAEYPELAVMYMSGYAEDVIAQRGVVEAGVHFLEKPFTSELLGAAVRRALDTRAD